MNNLNKLLLLFLVPLCLFSCSPQSKRNDGPRRIELLFLGHASRHHDSEQLAGLMSQEYFTEGINITYTNDPDDLLREDLDLFDGLILYANHDTISPAQEKALLDFVASGKGFIPLHSGSYCFRNSEEVVALIGGQFKSHGGGSFSAEIIKPDHPAMAGVTPFVTEWDETYVHVNMADDIEVLMERVDENGREPYTWVKNYGQGRVFYTAFGHDTRTFQNEGFLQLVKSGIYWAVGEQVVAKMKQFTIAQPQYEEARMPNYERRDPAPRYQLPLSPEESQTLIQVPVGFRLELFASEPDIRKPIAMEWDERGRLWVIETVDYPNTVRDDKGEGDDRIIICEDTNGDGKADKFTVFADKLNIPTAFTFANGGVIVAQAPKFLFLKDTDGDDVADVRETVFDGWGVFDTHAGPSNLRYGLDNQIWGTVGYSGFNGTVAGKEVKFSSGLYRFDVEGKDIEYLTSTSNNTWGLGFSEDFDIFASTANNEHSDFFAIPAKYYERIGLRERGIEKIDAHYNMHVLTKELRQVDVHGGFTAAAGHSLYTARAFPKEYWNRVAFINEPTGRVVHKHILEQVGSGFKEKGDGWNMVASSDNWFGPVESKVGPDGALWILDWYNFIIQHNPTPQGFDNGKGNAYIDPLRDNTRGRIYRLVYDNAPKQASFKLSKDKPSGLLKALKSDNMFWRSTAQRLIVEAGDQKIAKDLYKIIADTKVDEIGINGGALHALWALHGLGLMDGSNEEAINAALGALKHPAAGVRRAALQVLPLEKMEVLNQIDADAVLKDADLRVRLAALIRFADAPSTEAVAQAIFNAVQVEENIQDKWISHGLMIATAAHRGHFLHLYHGKFGQPALTETSGELIDRVVAGNNMAVMPLSTERRGMVNARQIPDYSNKSMIIVGEVKPNEMRRVVSEGVILSHGDNRTGYAVFVKDGKLQFHVNNKGRRTVIASTDPLPERYKFRAALLEGGKMSLSIDGKEVATGQTGGLFTELIDGFMRIGHNRQMGNFNAPPGTPAPKPIPNVGNYPDDFNFTGMLENARLVVVSNAVETTEIQKEAEDEIVIKAIIGEMKFDVTRFSAKAGKNLKIIFENPDHMQHNLLVLKPGSLERVGAAADALAKQANGAELQYIPASPDVLFSTPLVDPDQKHELIITVPSTPGEYPIVCTFPGHWRIMNGVMVVK